MVVAMASDTLDAATFKANQRAAWDGAASGWREQAEVTNRNWGFINDRLIELARIKDRDRVLDLASGIGDPALTVAHRVGPRGLVVVTDISASMLDVARERAADQGLANVQFREMDAESIDLPAGYFDAVVCRFGLMFLPDVLKSFKGIHRVLVPGGRLAAMTSRAPEPNIWAEWIFVPIQRALGVETAPPPGTPGIFTLGDPVAIERLLGEVGFREVRAEVSPYWNDFESGDELATWQFAINAPVRQMLASHSAERQKAAWQAVADSANRHADANGHIRVAGLNVEISAQKSSN